MFHFKSVRKMYRANRSIKFGPKVFQPGEEVPGNIMSKGEAKALVSKGVLTLSKGSKTIKVEEPSEEEKVEEKPNKKASGPSKGPAKSKAKSKTRRVGGTNRKK